MSRDDELRLLRERAYGPNADIETDTSAMARLQQLQQIADSTAVDEPAPEHPRRPPFHPRQLLWVALVVSVVVAGSTAAFAVAGALSVATPTNGADPVATLRSDPTLPWLTQVNSDSAAPSGGTRYDDYPGVAVVSVTPEASGQEKCLYVLPASTGGAIAGGCGAGPFPARAVLVVTASMPEQLTARHPPGGALQFELRGAQVIVYAADRYGAGVPPESVR